MWKYLRIAVTAISLLVCVLLIGLWARSYYVSEVWFVMDGDVPRIALASDEGLFVFMCNHSRSSAQHDWHVDYEDYSKDILYTTWEFSPSDEGLIVGAAYWFWLCITATIAALPWIKWRFSLRTLLIVMTLFALFFGAVAWSMRG